MFNYIYNSSYNILKVKVQSLLTISGIRNHYKYLEENRDLPQNLKVLIDCRNVKMDVNPEELKDLCKQMENTLSHYEFLHEAIIVENPFETAIAQIFEMYYNTYKNFRFNVFSTEIGALNQLITETAHSGKQ